MSDDPQVPDRAPTIRVVAMPADTNPAGDIFGGWLMSEMDKAAGTTAAMQARGRCATVAIDKVTFLLPVKVGDEVSIYTDIVRQGRTSMGIHVEAWRRTRYGSASQKVTEATFTFVALDDHARPRPINGD